MVIEETDMRICFLKVAHGDCDDAYGFTLRISDSCVGFSGDSAYCEAIEDIVRNSDAAVLDMSFAKGGKDHMGIDTVCEIISNNHKPVYATHMSTASRKQAEKLNNDLLIVTKDGQEVVI